MAFDRVLAIHDWYDGPRSGVAEISGVPHLFASTFNDKKDDYNDFYHVRPIPADILALVLEDWEIWLRWHAAWREGRAELSTHPALPEDVARHAEIEALIGNGLKVDPASSKQFRAKFRDLRRDGSWSGGEVEWTPLD